MEGRAWRVLLMLAILAAATTALPPQQAAWSYEEAVSLAIDLYNREPEGDFAFWLLEAKPQPKWDSSAKSPQRIRFTMKETNCPVSKERSLEGCAFKADGLEKECSGTFSAQQGTPITQFNCETVPNDHIRTRRSPSLIRKELKKANSRIF
ncbi:cathelicidin-related peptide Oh-Cath-like [Hemicordylus capensis]|uniref:cathelicidin-related peptide Oh-Cath-like n=1 Tax=Hemicordylus capensis TaxID=884348 RepID=UPI00230218FC|nr:cathelicidin-related peptide Oh-Cath-like [Hemicordylus capensis]